jgi:hypothetical protein
MKKLSHSCPSATSSTSQSKQTSLAPGFAQAFSSQPGQLYRVLLAAFFRAVSSSRVIACHGMVKPLARVSIGVGW